MPATERLHDRLAECDIEMKKIECECIDLQRAVDGLLSDFATKYPHADTTSLSEDFAARLSDIQDDLQGPAYRRKSRTEDEIGDIEWAELERQRPVTI